MAWSNTRGAKRAAAGIGSPASRWAEVGRAASATSQMTRSAGTSTGADAAIAAKSSAAPAAAVHEDVPRTMSRMSHGRSTWAIAAPRCPVWSDPKNGGATPHSTATTAGTQAVELKRRAENQAPRAARGRASR